MKLIGIICCLVLLNSCSKDTIEVERWYVADQQVRCSGVISQQTCFQIRENVNEPWRLLYDQIENFNYEPGFEYVIWVNIITIKDPPMDASNKRYILKRVISKK